jgi:hypothetical protein
MSTADLPHLPPLDEKFYSLSPDEAQFFKSQIGIEDDDDLKRHILAVQKKAYDVCTFTTLGTFFFVKRNVF